MPADYGRYIRQISLPELGLQGQRCIAEARVCVIGAGGLGSPVLLYLAAAGVGQLTFIESDVVELSNLHRQPLYKTEDIGQPKASIALRRLQALNPDIEIQAVQDRLAVHNAFGYLKGQDLVVETSDNFPTKFLVNDACYLLGIPLVLGGLLRFEGTVMSIQPNFTPCYRCIFHAPPPEDQVQNCAQAGVLGAMAGIVGSWQAAEALLVLTGIRKTTFQGITQFDLLSGKTRQIALHSNTDCPLCGERPHIQELLPGNYL